ncbi:MAG: hypothetical protein C4344_06785 [Acidimicrobiia bacterium]
MCQVGGEPTPVDIVKVDRVFVSSIDRGPEDSAIVRAVIRLAHGLRLTPVAEGIETAEQARLLRFFGCEYAQGFLFARPQPALDIEALLAVGKTAGGSSPRSGCSQRTSASTPITAPDASATTGW